MERRGLLAQRERGYCFERLLNSAAHVGAFKNETLAP